MTLALHVPVDQHAAAAVAGVPLGEDVLVVRPEVRGVRRHRGRARAPHLPGRAANVALAIVDRHRPGRLGGQVAAADVAQLVLAVAVLAGGDRPDPGVGAVGVHDQQQPLAARPGGDAPAGRPR